MASLHMGRVDVCPVHHHSGEKEKETESEKKRSSVHIITTSYIAEVVSPTGESPNRNSKTTPKYQVRLGYNDLAKNRYFHRSL